jgi:hypothetical protein
MVPTAVFVYDMVPINCDYVDTFCITISPSPLGEKIWEKSECLEVVSAHVSVSHKGTTA